MPIYEYCCNKCEQHFEFLQKISDAVITECPQCKTATLEKMISAAGFRLKGGGWYETDFKTGAKRNLAESDSKSVAKADSDKKASNNPSSTNAA